ncbi:5'-methylthioadenosine/adenosylhomocysteine nucleosidase [bacterium 1XD8-76]|nr:5'-methylthioadenosine/adenosylhomocysteine nucleosidase [bacterium 1XD8-76]
MKIGIICASDDELAPFLPIIEDCEIIEKAMLKFYKGTIYGVEVVALFSGVCKVNAAIASQMLVDGFGVDAIINSGVAGGMNPELQIFDTVISTEVCYHDVAEDILTEFHPWMNSVFFKADSELIKISKVAANNIKAEGTIYWGRMVTGEAFIKDEGRQEINDKFLPLSVDMETAGIAHVCYVNNIPFLAVRCITDTASHSGNEHFEENIIKASEIAAKITKSIICNLI